jgi:hypothetical protein
VGVYEKTVLLHIPGGVSVLDKTGAGNTVTVTFPVFIHPLLSVPVTM